MPKSVFVPCDCNTHALQFKYSTDRFDGDERAGKWYTMYVSDWTHADYHHHSVFNKFISRLKAAYQILRYGICQRDGLLIIESPERAKKIVDICSDFILACSSDQYGRYPDEDS